MLVTDQVCFIYDRFIAFVSGAMRGRPLRRKVSKLETLQHTINYIMELEEHIKKFHDVSHPDLQRLSLRF